MNYNQAKLKCATCTKCPLSANRTNMVWSRGPNTAAIMIIGEGPGAAEDASGTPFVDRAGGTLDRILEGCGLDGTVYITNVVKCRPPNNRAPFDNEADTCFPYLKAQIEHVDPLGIILLGRSACDLLFPGDYTTLRDIIHRPIFGEYSFMAAYHPSFINRQPPQLKEEMISAATEAFANFTDNVLPPDDEPTAAAYGEAA